MSTQQPIGFLVKMVECTRYKRIINTQVLPSFRWNDEGPESINLLSFKNIYLEEMTKCDHFVYNKQFIVCFLTKSVHLYINMDQSVCYIDKGMEQSDCTQ